MATAPTRTVAVQIRGELFCTVDVPSAVLGEPNAEEELTRLVLENPEVSKRVGGAPLKRVVVVGVKKSKTLLVNLVL